MLNLFELVRSIIWIITEAVVAYDATPEGKAQIDALLAEVEAAGFDVPFWSPAESDTSSDSNQDTGSDGVDERAARFAAKHPGIVNRGGE